MLRACPRAAAGSERRRHWWAGSWGASATSAAQLHRLLASAAHPSSLLCAIAAAALTALACSPLIWGGTPWPVGCLGLGPCTALGRDIPLFPSLPFSHRLPCPVASLFQDQPRCQPGRLESARPLPPRGETLVSSSITLYVTLSLCALLPRPLDLVLLWGWIPACFLCSPWWHLADLSTLGAQRPPERAGAPAHRVTTGLLSLLLPTAAVSGHGGERWPRPPWFQLALIPAVSPSLQVNRTCSPPSSRRSRPGASTPT